MRGDELPLADGRRGGAAQYLLWSSINGAASYDFPPELVALQRSFFAAEQAWREAAAVGDDDAVRRAYQDVHDLALQLHRNEWLNAVEGRYQTRMALREAARDATSATNGGS